MVQGIEEDEFVLNAVDIYDANRANASISETATPPNFPTINLSDVSVFSNSIAVKIHYDVSNWSSLFPFFNQSFNESEVIKTPGSATSVSKKVKVVRIYLIYSTIAEV